MVRGDAHHVDVLHSRGAQPVRLGRARLVRLVRAFEAALGGAVGAFEEDGVDLAAGDGGREVRVELPALRSTRSAIFVAIRAPPETGTLLPSQKSFCTSTTIKPLLIGEPPYSRMGTAVRNSGEISRTRTRNTVARKPRRPPPCSTGPPPAAHVQQPRLTARTRIFTSGTIRGHSSGSRRARRVRERPEFPTASGEDERIQTVQYPDR